MNKTLNHDMLMEIAINLDINDIQNICQTDQEFLNICSTQQFWINKYHHDHLPLLSKQNNIKDWIKDYVATKHTVNLLWLNKKESKILNKDIGIHLMFETSDLENSLLPADVKHKLLASEGSCLVQSTDHTGKEVYIQIDYNIGSEQSYMLYNLGEDFIFENIKYVFLSHIKYIADANHISYGPDLQNNMLNVDRWYLENHPDVMILRRSLLRQYNLDFGLEH